MKTIICDIDGTLFFHDRERGIDTKMPRPLPGAMMAVREWNKKEYNVILLTGRKECMRKETEEQLARFGIRYDCLVMGVRGWPRYLINDRKSNGEETAFVFNLERNGSMPKEIVDL
jgi:hypothetical protein